MNSKTIGEISELAIAAALAKAGWTILMPYGDNQRYDLVLEDERGFHKVQCKTGRLQRYGTVVVSDLRGGNSHEGSSPRGYLEDVDFFGIYCPQNDAVYLVPVSDAKKSSVTLRIEPAKNKQAVGCRMACDYEVRPDVEWVGFNEKVERPAPQPRPTVEERACPGCGKVFKPVSNRQKHCSRECGDASNRRYSLTDEQLREALKTKSPEVLGKELGVSGNAIRKRLKRIGKAA